jgi:DNA invertase Pin-like site-specific DNA recombinase
MAGQRIGYVRVSTFDQNPERQLDSTPVDRTFTDKASGKDAKRPQLEDMMSFARTGDTVVVHSMDRLARNLDDVRRIVRTLTRRGVRVEFVKEHLYWRRLADGQSDAVSHGGFRGICGARGYAES